MYERIHYCTIKKSCFVFNNYKTPQKTDIFHCISNLRIHKIKWSEGVVTKKLNFINVDPQMYTKFPWYRSKKKIQNVYEKCFKICFWYISNHWSYDIRFWAVKVWVCLLLQLNCVNQTIFVFEKKSWFTLWLINRLSYLFYYYRI